MKKMKVKNIVFVLFALFILIFVARAIYDIATYDGTGDINTGYFSNDSINMSSRESLQNIAGLRKEIVTSTGVEILDQKYEKIASITTKTTNYDEDERALKTVIEECSAIIQMENRSGLVGSRRISMTIGVKPDFFDAAVERLYEIGQITSFTTTKIDKTFEYRQMLAEKENLIRQIDRYQEMKNHGGSITELLLLEDRIIEYEALLKEQSVMLGDFSDENAMCTIHFVMYEGNVVGIWDKLWNALTWSVRVYLSFIGVLLLTCLTAFVILVVWKYGKKVYDKTTHKIAETDSTAKD